jgi:hypothetical protein
MILRYALNAKKAMNLDNKNALKYVLQVYRLLYKEKLIYKNVFPVTLFACSVKWTLRCRILKKNVKNVHKDIICLIKSALWTI